jgi:hypothetical protein
VQKLLRSKKIINIYKSKPCTSYGATDHVNSASILCHRNNSNFVNLKKCSACDGTDHVRSNSNKCLFYKAKVNNNIGSGNDDVSTFFASSSAFVS